MRSLVQGAVRSGLWAQHHTVKAAEIASHFWGQPVELVEYALNTPKNRIVFDRYIPVQDELQKMADLMVRFDLLEQADISGLIDDRFARAAQTAGIEDLKSIFIK